MGEGTDEGGAVGLLSMRCAHVLERLERYCDQEAGSWERVRIQRHLAVCEECLSHKEFRVALTRIVREKCGRADLPPAVAERILGRLFPPGPEA
jgi:anti-sigma factor (TIGR02949 family)